MSFMLKQPRSDGVKMLAAAFLLVGLGLLCSFAAFIAGVCFEYSLDSFLCEDIPFYADIIAGLLLSPIVIPLAIVCWILRFFLPTPFINR